MKILMLTDSMDMGGAETHIRELALALVEKGHRVLLVNGGGRLADALAAHGVRTVTLPLSSRSPLAVRSCYRQLLRLVRRERPNLIHAHARFPALLACGVSHRTGVPVVTTVHARFRTGIRRLFSRWGVASVAVSEDLKNYLSSEYRIPPENITVIPNGIDTRRFAPLPPKPETTADKPFRIVFMSRMDDDCSLGAELLCRLAPALSKKIPHLQIELIGGGSAVGRIAELAGKQNVLCRGCISVTGGLETSEVRLRGADSFVGVSRAALEAMACGVPVILGGNEGFLGILTPKNFPVAAAENFCCRSGEPMTKDRLFHAITTLFDMERTGRTALADKIRQEVLRRFDRDGMAEKTVAFYRNALRQKIVSRAQVVLCGYYGYGNAGDDALLRAAIDRLRRDGIFRISALTLHGKRDSARFGVRCVRRTSPFAVLCEIRRAERLVFGGGTLIQDATSRRSLFYYALLLRYAERHGVKCELWGSGIGPITHPLCRRVAAKVLAGCERIGLRDAQSEQLLRKLIEKVPSAAGRRPRIYREDDLAQGTRSAGAERTAYLLRRAGLRDGAKIAVAAIKGDSPPEYYREIGQKLCEWKRKGVTPLVAALYPRADRRACKKLCRQVDGIFMEGLSAADWVGIFRAATAVYGMRLHALIFASAAGVPFFPFGDDPKLLGFCEKVLGGVR